MPAKYYVTLTDYGSSLVAQAHNIVSIQLTHMVIGDANNQPYEPIDQKNRVSLINERARVPIQSVEVIEQIAQVSTTIEAHIGGFNIHEYGFIDTTGQLVYIANYHGAYKPVIAEGAGGELEIVTQIKADSGAQVLIQIDSNIVTANKEWVNHQINTLKEALLLEIQIAIEDVEIGDLFLTTLNFENAEAVASHKKFGIWQQYGDGHALVLMANSENHSAPAFMQIMGSTGGEYQHKQTHEQLAKHKHSKGNIFNKFVSKASDVVGTNLVTRDQVSPQHDADNTDLELATGYFSMQGWNDSIEQEVGESEPFNIVQSSIIIGAWLRIA